MVADNQNIANILNRPDMRDKVTFVTRSGVHARVRVVDDGGCYILECSSGPNFSYRWRVAFDGRALRANGLAGDPSFDLVSWLSPESVLSARTETTSETKKPEPAPIWLTTDSNMRKRMPVATGVLAYFPRGLMCVAHQSWAGNEKHHPGTPLHWDQSKSTDEADAAVRHYIDEVLDTPPEPGFEALGSVAKATARAWRALADLERQCMKLEAEYNAKTETNLDLI